MTPEYASPEQVRGERDHDRDRCLRARTAALRAPHRSARAPPEDLQPRRDRARRLRVDAGSAEHITRAARTATRSEIGATRSTTWEKLRTLLIGDLDQIILTAIRKEPERRYASAGALAEDIRRYLAGRPVQAQGDAWTYRPRKFVQRNALPVVGRRGRARGPRDRRGGDTLAGTRSRARAAGRGNAATPGRAAPRGSAEIATSFVFEFHDSIANLAGATPARQLVVSKGVEYLDRLAKDASRDRTLQRDLADAYDRMSEIQASPFGSNVGDVRAGLESMQKAMAIRRGAGAAGGATIARGASADARAAAARRRVSSGGPHDRSRGCAIAHVVTSGEATLARGDNAEARLRVGLASHRLCGILMPLGDASGAPRSLREEWTHLRRVDLCKARRSGHA